MKRVTKADAIRELRRVCTLLGVPCVYDERGEFLPQAEREDHAHAFDFGGGASSNVPSGVSVHALLAEGGGHVRAHDAMFRTLDQRKPLREVVQILTAIGDTLEAVDATRREAVAMIDAWHGAPSPCERRELRDLLA